MNGQAVTKAFIPLPAGATAVYTSGPTLSYFRHPDWLGSSRFASTPARTMYYSGAYAPFGEAYGEAGTADRSFTGQNQYTVPDHTAGLYDFLFREYAQYGRWISPDPAGIAAVNPANPQSWNRYAYALNYPTGIVDPLGLCGEADSYSTNSEGQLTVTGYRPCGLSPLDSLVYSRFEGANASARWVERGPGWLPSVVSQNPPAPPQDPCAAIAGKRGVIPFQGDNNLLLQFDANGSWTGFSIRLTDRNNSWSGGGIVIPPDTFAGVSVDPAGLTFGFTNPVYFQRAYGSGAYIQTMTFSGGKFTEVRGAPSLFTIPGGSTTASSSLLKWKLNTMPGMVQLGQTLSIIGDILSNIATCQNLVGGN